MKKNAHSIILRMAIAFTLWVGSAKAALETLETSAITAEFDTANGRVKIVDNRSGSTYQTVSGPRSYEGSSTVVKRDQISFILKNDHVEFTAIWSFIDESTLVCRIDGDLSQALKDRDLAYPYPITMSTSGSYWVMPDAAGFLFKTDGSDLPRMRLTGKGEYKVYDHYHAMMAFYGQTDMTSGVVTVFDTPADVAYRFWKFKDKQLGEGVAPSMQWRPEHGTMGYVRQVRYHFSPEGGIVPLAKYYRKQVVAKGAFRSLRDKLKERPYVDRLVGAPHVWLMNLSGTRSTRIIDEMNELGVEKLVLKTDMHVKFPEYRDPTLGEIELQQAEHDAFQARAEELGYLFGKYMTYSSIRSYGKDTEWRSMFWNFYMLRDDNFFPYSGLMRSDGSRMLGWEGQGVRVCDLFGLEELIPEHLKLYGDYFRTHNCFFFDVEGALSLQECYDPKHPMTRRENLVIRKDRAELFRNISEDWVIGTESGADFLLPHYDWVEGPPTAASYVDRNAMYKDAESPYYMGGWNRDKDFDPPQLSQLTLVEPTHKRYGLNMAMRIPLYELVHGDQVVSVCRWEYTNNKATDVWWIKDLRCMLYGTPPAYSLNPDLWDQQKHKIVGSMKTVTPWVEEIGYDEMVDFEFLTDDKLVQKSTFSSGKSIVVNFRPGHWYRYNGNPVIPQGFLIVD